MWIEEYGYNSYKAMMAEEEPIGEESFKKDFENEEELIDYYRKYDYEFIDKFYNNSEYCFKYVGEEGNDINYICAKLEKSF